MNAKWGCLSILAVCAIAWNVFAWAADDPPDVGAPCVLLLGLGALVVIYAGSAIERRTKKQPRGFRSSRGSRTTGCNQTPHWTEAATVLGIPAPVFGP